jgi:hypothetical protein
MISNQFFFQSNDTTNVLVSSSNSTIQSGIRQTVTYGYKIYLPTYSQGRLQITIASIQNASSVTVNIISASILSAGINVGSFMNEYSLGNKYQWTYSSSVLGSTYQDTAYLDLGVVTNTGKDNEKIVNLLIMFIRSNRNIGYIKYLFKYHG